MFVSYTLIKCVTNAAKEDLKPEQLHVAAASVECLTWRGGGGGGGGWECVNYMWWIKHHHPQLFQTTPIG